MSNDDIVIYSHGFGVDKTDRGLFTEIASYLPEYRHVMFDYNFMNENGQIVTTALDKQASALRNIYDEIRSQNPDSTIHLICHSQGCVVAGLARIPVVSTFCLAPPLGAVGGSDDKLREMVYDRPGTKDLEGGGTWWPRSDGNVTIISKEYWESYGELPELTGLYGELADVTELVMFVATEDELLGQSDCSGLSQKIRVIEMETGHNFLGVREDVTEMIGEVLRAEKKRVTYPIKK